MNKNIFPFLYLFSLVLLITSSKLALSADYLESPLSNSQTMPSDIGQYIRNLFIFGLGLVGLVALFGVVYDGLNYILAGTSETRKTAGKQWISAAVIGVVLLLCAFLILNTINPALITLQDPQLMAIEIPPHLGLGYNLTSGQLRSLPVRADPAVSSIMAQACAQYNVPENIGWALLGVESSGDKYAVSSKGAQGLMQLMPGTAAALGVTDRTDPSQAIPAGIRYLRMMYDEFGTWENAVAAYNCGPKNLSKYGGDWQNVPFSETQNHVRKVFGSL
jgi:hypothetical protein